MGVSRSRTITLVVAIATLTSNILSSLLFSQLPDDPYHLAGNFGWYLHFANILSVFGFIGALREHALSIAIFANYLILDTLLSAIPRFLLVSLLSPLSTTLCSSPLPPSSSSSDISSFQSTYPPHNPHLKTLQQPSLTLDSTSSNTWESLSANWSPDGCFKIVYLAQITIGASVVAATLLQFVGALNVREYAKMLWVRELREEERIVAFVGSRGESRGFLEERGLPLIEEEFEGERGEKLV